MRPSRKPPPEPGCVAPCLASAPRATGGPQGLGDGADRSGMELPRRGLRDEEGACVKPGLPPIVDGHVHVFPPRLSEAIWRWFDAHGWPIRYKLHARETVRYLLERGVGHVVALHYAHKPGMARALNAFVAELAREESRVVGFGTVFPGEPGAIEIVREAFALGLTGIKLHCHVQAMAPDDDALHDVYAACQEAERPVVIHAGREPRSDAYRRDPHELCDAGRMEAVLRAFPRLPVCVPHLGADEFADYERLLERHDNLWLDTTMVLAEYFETRPPRSLLDVRPERVLYGTDFPNIPYAWDRELVRIGRAGLSDERLARLLGENAKVLYRIGTAGSLQRGRRRDDPS